MDSGDLCWEQKGNGRESSKWICRYGHSLQSPQRVRRVILKQLGKKQPSLPGGIVVLSNQDGMIYITDIKLHNIMGPSVKPWTPKLQRHSCKLFRCPMGGNKSNWSSIVHNNAMSIQSSMARLLLNGWSTTYYNSVWRHNVLAYKYILSHISSILMELCKIIFNEIKKWKKNVTIVALQTQNKNLRLNAYCIKWIKCML